LQYSFLHYYFYTITFYSVRYGTIYFAQHFLPSTKKAAGLTLRPFENTILFDRYNFQLLAAKPFKWRFIIGRQRQSQCTTTAQEADGFSLRKRCLK